MNKKLEELEQKAKNIKPSDKPNKQNTKTAQALKVIKLTGFSTEKKEHSSILIYNHKNIRIEPPHPLQSAVNKLLKDGELDKRLMDNDYKKLYDFLSTQSNIQRAKVLEQLAKLAKIPKGAIENGL